MDTLEPTIEYRPIPNFPGYRIGCDGSVWTCKRNRWGLDAPWRRLATKINVNGYDTVGLWHNNQRTLKLVHALVLEGFLGPRADGLWALHKNDNRLDNHLTNLYWGTHQDNIQDAKTNKRFHGRKTLLTTDVVISIRALAAQGNSQAGIARQLSLHIGTVRSILFGRTRKDVT